MKISSIYTRRLAKALSAFDIKLTSSQLLEVAAAAAGYHNSNEFTAAAKKGKLTPPPAEAIGKLTLQTGETLIIVRDKLSGSPYGIDESFVEQVIDEEVAEKIGVTPYGNLIWLADLSAKNMPDIFYSDTTPDTSKPDTLTVYTAIIDHKHGSNQYAALSEEKLFSQIAAYCREYWHELGDEGPEQSDDLTDRALIEIYFEHHDREWLNHGRFDLDHESIDGALK